MRDRVPEGNGAAVGEGEDGAVVGVVNGTNAFFIVNVLVSAGPGVEGVVADCLVVVQGTLLLDKGPRLDQACSVGGDHLVLARVNAHGQDGLRVGIINLDGYSIIHSLNRLIK